jgi:NAD(P)-dependent dehydrogenase (short-subunit alcohol dehydrogenase family)
MAPKKAYRLAEKNEDKFVKKLARKASIMPAEYYKKGMAYTFSKLFVIWYAKKSAFDLGKQGIRVVSLSPGLIATDMGNMEVEVGGSLIPNTAENRMGTPDELGYAIATVADPRNGFLTAVDVLCDGGSSTRMKEFKLK